MNELQYYINEHLKNNPLDYIQAYQAWLNAHRQNPPEGFADVGNILNAPENYFLTPEDAMVILEAKSPYQLYTNPNNWYYGNQFNYPTSAINIRRNPGEYGIQDAIIQMSRQAQNPLSPLMTAGNYRFPIQPLGTQGIYEHEVGHFQDPRLNPSKMWSFPNKGYTTYGGLSGGLLQREFPAMVKEENFWDNLLNRQ